MSKETRLLTLPQMLKHFPEVERYPCVLCDGLGILTDCRYDIEPVMECCQHCDGYGELYLIKNHDNRTAKGS